MIRILIGASLLILPFMASDAMADTYFLKQDLGVKGTQHLCQYTNNRVYAVSLGQTCAMQIEDQPNMAVQTETTFPQTLQHFTDSLKPPSELEQTQTQGQDLANARAAVQLQRSKSDAAMQARADQEQENQRNLATLSQLLNRDVSTSPNLTGTGDVLCVLDEVDNFGLVQGGQQKVKLHLGQDGFVSLPQTMLPPIKAGGQNGRWKLSEAVVTDMDITTEYKLNLFNHPKVHIDRVSGNVTIDGLKHYIGRCAGMAERQLF